MIKGLQKRLRALSPANPIICMAVHPGVVNTFLHRLPLQFLVNPIATLLLDSPAVGSYNSSFAAASPLVRRAGETGRYQGSYLIPVGKFEAESENLKNEELLTEFWDNTVRILEEWEESGTFDRTTVGNVKPSEASEEL